MEFWKVDTPPQEKPIEGYYISNTGKHIKFTMLHNFTGKEDITLMLEGSSK